MPFDKFRKGDVITPKPRFVFIDSELMIFEEYKKTIDMLSFRKLENGRVGSVETVYKFLFMYEVDFKSTFIYRFIS